MSESSSFSDTSSVFEYPTPLAIDSRTEPLLNPHITTFSESDDWFTSADEENEHFSDYSLVVGGDSPDSDATTRVLKDNRDLRDLSDIGEDYDTEDIGYSDRTLSSFP
jgi:hypothetical protein